MPNAAKVAKNTRRHPRFKGEPSQFAELDLTNDRGAFQTTHVGLVLNQSSKGCCLVIESDEPLQVGSLIWVRLPGLVPMEAEVRWAKLLDVDVCKVGIYFLD